MGHEFQHQFPVQTAQVKRQHLDHGLGEEGFLHKSQVNAAHHHDNGEVNKDLPKANRLRIIDKQLDGQCRTEDRDQNTEQSEQVVHQIVTDIGPKGPGIVGSLCQLSAFHTGLIPASGEHIGNNRQKQEDRDERKHDAEREAHNVRLRLHANDLAQLLFQFGSATIHRLCSLLGCFFLLSVSLCFRSHTSLISDSRCGLKVCYAQTHRPGLGTSRGRV